MGSPAARVAGSSLSKSPAPPVTRAPSATAAALTALVCLGTALALRYVLNETIGNALPFVTMFGATAERCGRVDILVNNAARTVSRSLWDIDADEWDDVLAVNLRGVLFGCQIAGPHMEEHGWGRIINLASIAGQQGGLISGAHYAASKAGILVLTKIAAKALAPSGVTVNAIAPAAISGPIMDALPEDVRAGLPAAIPVGRVGSPEEVAATAVEGIFRRDT